jgi:hypothetical protein
MHFFFFVFFLNMLEKILGFGCMHENKIFFFKEKTNLIFLILNFFKFRRKSSILI